MVNKWLKKLHAGMCRLKTALAMGSMLQVRHQSGKPARRGPSFQRSRSSVRALLASRALLVKIKRDLENHVRGLLKNLSLVIGRAKFNVFAVRAEELIEGRPELIAAIRPLLEARNAVERQVSELDRKVMKLARHDAQV